RELPVADNPAPVAVIDLFMPARFTLSLSLPQTIVVRRRATVEPRSAPSFPSFDLKLEEILQSEPESVESCQEHEGTGKGLWGVVGAVAIMLLMILLI